VGAFDGEEQPMPNRDELNALLTPFDPILLSQMNDVALLSRFEVKYVSIFSTIRSN